MSDITTTDNTTDNTINLDTITDLEIMNDAFNIMMIGCRTKHVKVLTRLLKLINADINNFMIQYEDDTSTNIVSFIPCCNPTSILCHPDSVNTTTTWGAGFGNILIANLACHFICKISNLKFNYKYKDELKELGIELFEGENTYKNIALITVDNFYNIIKYSTALNSNLRFNTYFQTPEFSLFIYAYFNTIKDSIMKANIFKNRYQNNNDVFVHIRLGDVTEHNPGYDYYDSVLSKLTFDSGYIASDTIDDEICQRLIIKYKLSYINLREHHMIMFASVCKHIVLSHGTFSWLFGAMAFFSDIYYSGKKATWHGDIFNIPTWIKI
jgi:hypothetical protein